MPRATYGNILDEQSITMETLWMHFALWSNWRRAAAAASKYHAPPPPTKVDQRAAAAAEPKHPVRRRRPNVIGVGSSPPGLEKSWLVEKNGFLKFKSDFFYVNRSFYIPYFCYYKFI